MIETGWRILYSIDAQDKYLRSTQETIRWPHRQAFRAECLARDHESRGQGQPPLGDCNCGIYAMSKPDDRLRDYLRYTPNVGIDPNQAIVEIAQWGRVFVGSTGQRSEFACVKTIYVASEERAKMLGEAYAVPAFSGDVFDELVKKIHAAIPSEAFAPGGRRKKINWDNVKWEDLDLTERQMLAAIEYQEKYHKWYNRTKVLKNRIPWLKKELEKAETEYINLQRDKPKKRSF